jgi:menaquinone-dependent protoporphyrinogen IX oxidase
MNQRILVAYATWAGSTGEVAHAISHALRDEGRPVEVLPCKGVADVGSFDAVVVGTGIHAGHVHHEFARFVKKHREALSGMPTAYFVVCLTMKEDTEENRCKAGAFLDKVRKAAPEVQPIDVGLFGGAVRMEGEEYEKLFLPLRLVLRAMRNEQGDQSELGGHPRLGEGPTPRPRPAKGQLTAGRLIGWQAQSCWSSSECC